MTSALLLDAGHLEVLVRDGQMGAHLLEGLVGNGVDAQLLLALGQGQPQLAPGRVAGALAKELRHGGAAVPRRQRRLVRVERRGHFGGRSVERFDGDGEGFCRCVRLGSVCLEALLG